VPNEVLDLQCVAVDKTKGADAAARELFSKEAAYGSRANDQGRAAESRVPCVDG
jgi:hypothetical protein